MKGRKWQDKELRFNNASSEKLCKFLNRGNQPPNDVYCGL